ncbi:MAG: gliding motility-associated ABC transporter substrate-binding protein GldG [Flavobacteriales bacterium]|nr:gliding motility-associated ABC transporter substrate-binding protein GldG [Flavobacteriales bacterium]MCC6938657.1 gliding motility-associated ABC transporter substrate-binding protein GldG [Flavobacteriales bacterium]
MAKETTPKQGKLRSKRLGDLGELAVGIGIVLLVLFIASFFRLRIDLTSEQRYTLTPATRDLVSGLEDIMYVKVYLTGELPADLKQLERATRDVLDEMRASGGDRIEYSFVDPNASADQKTRNEVYDQLQQQGLTYSSIRIKEKGGYSERIVFPGALVTYRDKTVPVQLLRTQLRTPDADIVQKSITNVEYELASSFRQATTRQRPRIAFLEGHGELQPIEVMDITNALSAQYDVSRVRIDGRVDALSRKNEVIRYRLNDYEALVIAKPDSAFSDRDRYVIDQFVMNGGKILWCISAMDAHLDSLRTNQFSMATPLDLGVEELLFAYGVRINKDLILDQSCAPIEIYTQPYGNQRKLERFPWFFEPVLIPQSAHPIVANIDPVHTRFASSMDTIGVDSVKKTILLTSSPRSFAQRNPVRISLNMVEMDQGFERRSTPYLPMAVLLEGKFRSAYYDRLPTAIVTDKDVAYRERSPHTAQLVISDGDVIENRVDAAKGMFYMLGFDRYANAKIYGNRELILNAMNYLLDDRSLISIRSRAITLRQLDMNRVEVERRKWQVINLAVPLLISLVLGLAYQQHRRRSNLPPKAKRA